MKQGTHSRRFIPGLLGIFLVAGCSIADTGGDLGGDTGGDTGSDIGVHGFADVVSSSRAPLITAAPGSAIPGHYIVVFNEDASKSSVYAAMNRVLLAGDDSRVDRSFSIIPGFSGRLGASTLERLRRDPKVLYVEEEQLLRIDGVYDSPAHGIDRSDQRKGRDGTYDDHGFNGSGVHIYIVDTGIRTTHTEFAGRIGTGFTSIDDENGVEDCHGHGTHVASTAAGFRYGMAKGATLHPVRVMTCEGAGTTAGVLAGLDFARTDCAAQSGPCVANLSLGGTASQTLDDAVAAAVDAGVIVVVAAGNDTKDACSVSPARASASITVAATDENDRRASFSNYGSCVDIFAPGENILGAWIDTNNATKTISGTSMATPHVSGAVAQHLQSRPGATAAQVKAAMKSAATPSCVDDAGTGSPNLLLFNDFSQPGAAYACEGSGSEPGDPGDGAERGDDSCVNHCGDQAPGGCYCDFWCIIFGDCCRDLLTQCL